MWLLKTVIKPTAGCQAELYSARDLKVTPDVATKFNSK